jgi:tRNA threonylcarbamoyladenosine biosynthesis protein TsaB
MRILALELSSVQRSVAVAEAGQVLGEAVSDVAEPRATRAFALVERALREAGASREQIECLAVGLGPGSYTGIRVSIAMAQGWQLARGVRLLGVASSEALGSRAWEEGWRGRVHVAIDAQRQEACLGTYQLDSDSWREISRLRLAPAAEVRALLEAGQQVIGPDMAQWGSPISPLFPHARQIARLAADRADYRPGNELAPIYLRTAAFVKAPPPRTV